MGKVLTPTPGFEEQCYYHAFGGKPGLAAIFNHDRGYGLAISFDSSSLSCFTQWKMMGVKDYVMGLEPGNCYPDGRDVMREKGPFAVPRARREENLWRAADDARKRDAV